MKPSEIRELIRLEPVTLDPVERRLARCLTTEDLRRIARRRLPRAVFDYVDGGADEEVTLAENRAAFQRWRLVPRVLRDVSRPDLSTEVLGRSLAAPLGLCPTGYTRMMHPEGEAAVARAAKRRGLPYALSTVGTTTIEDLAATGHQELWFQLYPLKDRGLTRSLVERAAESGFRVLEVAVDTAVSGRRERDVRNGLTIPPALRLRTVLDIGRHLGYWTSMVRGPALEFASFGEPKVGEDRVTAANMANLFNPSLDWDDLAEIRDIWGGPLLLKGPVGPEDARRAVEAGAEGVHLSNHGGRQLDRSEATVDLVRPLREALGEDRTIVLDSGVRHGADVVTALALGADLCCIGRPYLYGLAAGGERGVGRVLDLLIEQLRRTMQLLGVGSVTELRAEGASLVTSREARVRPGP